MLLKIKAMKRNISIPDITIRVILAINISIMVIYGIIIGTLAIWAVLASGFLLITAFIRHCPIYMALGVSTRKKHLTNRPFGVLRHS